MYTTDAQHAFVSDWRKWEEIRRKGSNTLFVCCKSVGHAMRFVVTCVMESVTRWCFGINPNDRETTHRS